MLWTLITDNALFGLAGMSLTLLVTFTTFIFASSLLKFACLSTIYLYSFIIFIYSQF